MEKKVTRIENQKKCRERVNVYLDNEYAFSCSLDAIVKNKLNLGKTIDSSFLDSIIEEDNYTKGKACALRVLERGLKSEKEIMTKLKDKGFDGKTCERVIAMLKEYKYVDDDKLTDIYIDQKLKSEGSNKIRGFLYRKGIPEEMIKGKISGIEEETEEEVAFNLASKKYSALQKNETDKRKLYKKTGEFLMRKGYSYEISRRALNRIFDDINGGE
ncbi:MAG: recombination regulator RecX [Clostridiaceae bacterium]